MITRSLTAGAHRRLMGKALLTCAVTGALLATTVALPATSAKAQGTAPITTAQSLPGSVLLFPAVIMADNGSVAPPSSTGDEAEEIITEAVRKFLSKAGIGVVVYSKRLPSIQRAVAEATVKAEDAANGPGDDVRKAQQFAQLLGSTEYITVSVENYKYDTASRTATFNLSVERRATSDAVTLGASAQKGTGSAPQDVAGLRQEGSAVARASEVVAEQTVTAVYPSAAAAINPPKEEKSKKKKRVGAAALLIPVVALGTWLIAD
jgi:hypothetical protein